MLTIGLTGGYATGKSTVAAMLRSLGAVVVDADELSHEAIKKGTPGWDEAVKAFGQGILSPGGEIDRGALGKLVFHRADLRKELERIIHPRVMAAMRAAMSEAERDDARIFVGEVPLLFEAGLAGEFDLVWVVSSDSAQQLSRAERRDFLGGDDLRARLEAQMPMEEKERRADLVLRNDGSLAELRQKVREAWEGLSRKKT